MNISRSFSSTHSYKGPLRVSDTDLKNHASVNATEAPQDASHMSHDALLLTEALRTAQNTPDVRADRVETLRQLIAQGKYEINSLSIARSLVRETPDLFRL